MESHSKIWDPLRGKEVALTAEESVRQWFISVLNSNMKVPLHLMGSEVGLETSAIGKKYRADIVIYDKNAAPVAIVECKRPEVELTQETIRQALRYDTVLNVRYFFITNGSSTFACKRENGRFTFLADLPDYEQMICQL